MMIDTVRFRNPFDFNPVNPLASQALLWARSNLPDGEYAPWDDITTDGVVFYRLEKDPRCARWHVAPDAFAIRWPA